MVPHAVPFCKVVVQQEFDECDAAPPSLASAQPQNCSASVEPAAATGAEDAAEEPAAAADARQTRSSAKPVTKAKAKAKQAASGAGSGKRGGLEQTLRPIPQEHP